MIAFTDGIWYFRTPCLEPGPDFYYLFRFRIKCISLTDKGGLCCDLEDLMPNLFKKSCWVEHPTKPGPIVFEPFVITEHGQKARLPLTTAISPSITFLRLDSVAEAIIYSDESEQPENNPMKDFPKGYEFFS